MKFESKRAPNGSKSYIFSHPTSHFNNSTINIYLNGLDEVSFSSIDENKDIPTKSLHQEIGWMLGQQSCVTKTYVFDQI